MDQKYKVILFQNARGEKPINSFILNQDGRTKAQFRRLHELLSNYGPYLEMPYSKRIGKNLYELRGKGKIKIRIFYTHVNQVYVLLHIFKKKSQKTPTKEIQIALNRLTDI